MPGCISELAFTSHDGPHDARFCLSRVPMPAIFIIWLAGIFIGFIAVIQRVKMIYFKEIRLRGKRQKRIV